MTSRWVAPPDPYELFPIGCVRVYYPDHPFLFAALMGQISGLGRQYKWDTGGDLVAAAKLEQDWREATEQTWLTAHASCPDTEDCEQTIIDLTIELEQCQEQLEEYENMEITVNCNCGGCGTCVDIPELTAPDGTPIETTPVPVDPNNPFDETTTTWDDAAEIPPEGWVDYDAFSDDRCLLANYGVDAFLESAEKLDDAENRGSIVADIAALLILFVPIPVGKIKGYLTFLKWAANGAKLLAVSETALDWVQWFSDMIVDNKEEFVCDAYTATSIDEAASRWVDRLQILMAAYPPILALTSVVRDQLEVLYTDIMTDLAPLIQSYVAKTFIPEGYVPEFDCSSCEDTPEVVPGFHLVEATISQHVADSGEGGGTSNHVVTVGAGTVAIAADADGANRNFTPQFYLDAPPNPPVSGGRYIGFVYQAMDFVNCTEIRFAAGDSVNPKVWNGAANQYASNFIYIISDGANNTAWESVVIQDATIINESTSIGINECDLGTRGLQVGTRSTAAGNFSATLGKFYWIVEDALACP